ncbi:MAG: transporter substrate-binding domain-containing protein [Magnetococcales bacterium]|nr:transporter substrate-binding domain-containing protein [Magnetococcales bacterium]
MPRATRPSLFRPCLPNWSAFLFGFALLWNLLFWSHTALASELTLTAEEADYISQHPVIRVANEMDWPPFDYNEFGKPKGLAIEFIQLLADQVGLEIRFINGYTWEELLQRFQQGQIDVVPVMYRNAQREAYTLFSRPYYRGKLGVLTHTNGPPIQQLSDLENKRVGIQKSHGAIPIIRKNIPDIQFIEHPGYDTLVKALGTQKLDAIIGNPLLFSHFMKENQIQDLRLAHFIPMTPEEQAKTSFHIGVGLDQPILHRILDKAIAAVSREEMTALEARWSPFHAPSQPTVTLTEEQRALLKRMAPLTFCVDPDWMPYERINEQDVHEGMSADFIELLTKRLGVPMVLHATDSWSETLVAARDHRCDLLPLAQETPERQNYLDFTTPLLHAPYVVATRSDRLFIEDIAQHQGKTFSVVRDYGLIDELRQRYPGIHLLEVKNVHEGLQQVIDGQVLGYIGTTAVVGQVRYQYGLCDIKIAGQLPLGYELRVATRNDIPQLGVLMQYAVDSISPTEIQRIQDKWMAVDVQKVADYRLISQVVGGFIVLLLFFTYWNRRLHREVEKRAQVEQALREAKSQAEAANLAKSEFLAIMSHEIRTPLNVLLGMSDVLKESTLTEQQREQLGMVHQSGDHLLNIINDILDLSKIEIGGVTLESAPFQPGPLFSMIGDMMQSRAQEKGLRFDFEQPDDLPPWVLGDEGRLRQVLINLLGNAIKFTEQGRVSLNVAYQSEGSVFEIRIIDTGVGIAPEHLEQVFDKFTQADASISRRYGGTGLGLAISRNLVELMGGTIAVESDVGQGSIFHLILTLPPAQAPASYREEQSHLGAQMGLVPLEILLVEDSQDNRTLILTYLKKTPWGITIAIDGQKALERVKAGGIDLVLMDIQMPVMDGYTATREIRAWEQQEGAPRLPILALSAHALESEKRKSLEAGCDDHLVKPIKKKHLIQAIQEAAMGLEKQGS